MGRAWVIVAVVVLAGCDRVYGLDRPAACPHLFCADFDTRATGKDLFPTEYETAGSGAVISTAGPAVSEPNSMKAEITAGLGSAYAILQAPVGTPGFHGTIEFWVAVPGATLKCSPYFSYFRLDTEPLDQPMPYQVQVRLSYATGAPQIMTRVQAPSGIKTVSTPIVDPEVFHFVRLEIDVPNQLVTQAIDDGAPAAVPSADLSGAGPAQPEIQVGMGLDLGAHTACTVLLDDLIISAL